MQYRAQRKRPKRVVNKEITDQKDTKKRFESKNQSSSSFSCSFLTIILLLCLIQITLSAVLNISKIISYNAKIKQITNTRNAAQDLNKQLKDNINNFSNVSGLEAIARNNLKMSSKDEVMVIINTPKENPTEPKQKKFHFLKNKTFN